MSATKAKAKLLAQLYGTKSSGSVSCATVRKGKRRRKKKRGKSKLGGIVLVDDASIPGKFSAEAVDAKWESWERKGLGDEPVVVGSVVGGKELVANASVGTIARASGRRRTRKRRVADSGSDSDMDIQRKSTKTPNSSSDSDMEVRRKPRRVAAQSDSSSDLDVERSKRKRNSRARAASDSSDISTKRSTKSDSDSDSDMDLAQRPAKGASKTKRSTKSDSDSDSDMDLAQRPAKGASKQKQAYTRATGQITAAQLAIDQKIRKEREEAQLKASGALKPNAKTTYRDANGNIIKDINAVMAEKAKEDAKYTLTKQEQQRQSFSWNMGAADKRRIVEKREKLEKMKSVPFARKLGGAESREHDLTLRDQIRPDDPMAAYMKQRRKKRRKKEKKKTRKTYNGPPAPPHRFGQEIQPGYRWDGVDRSNGHEKKLLTERAHLKQDAERAYKWRSSDM